MSTASDAEQLARWIRAILPATTGPLTHLKLQKLAFYTYGAALAFGVESEIGDTIRFEAWDHGPVSRPIWQRYKDFGGAQIPPLASSDAPRYSPEAETPLRDMLAIYGVMDPWSLRLESHLEDPWIEARRTASRRMDRDVLRNHFVKKLRGPRVDYPVQLLNPSNMALDGIPVHGQPSLHDLALAVQQVWTAE